MNTQLTLRVTHYNSKTGDWKSKPMLVTEFVDNFKKPFFVSEVKRLENYLTTSILTLYIGFDSFSLSFYMYGGDST